MNLTPDQYKQAMASAVKVVEANVGKIMLNGANLGSALMQRRVFNKGIATSGKKMMYRSAPYKRLRVDAKLQIAHKDLIFTGNLFNSLTILGKSNKEVSYGFNNNETATIANYQETSSKQVNQPIFDLSKKEISQVERAMAKDVLRVVVATIESYPNMPSVSPLQEDSIKKSVARNQAKKKKQRIQKKATSEKAKAKRKIESKEKTRQAITKQVEIIKKREDSYRQALAKLSKVKNEKQYDKLRAIADKKQESLFRSRTVLANKKKALEKLTPVKRELTKAEKRIARAKAMRQGTHKPKKRKKS
jgi:hypothetical protein